MFLFFLSGALAVTQWVVTEQYPTNTSGPHLITEVWNVRNLTNLVSIGAGTGHIKLGAAPAGPNQLLIKAGTYSVVGSSSVFCEIDVTTLRLFDVTTNTTLLTGVNAGAYGSTADQLVGFFTIDSTRIVELQTWLVFFSGGPCYDGFPAYNGLPEVYSQISFTLDYVPPTASPADHHDDRRDRRDHDGLPWWGWLLIAIGIVLVVFGIAIAFYCCMPTSSGGVGVSQSGVPAVFQKTNQHYTFTN